MPRITTVANREWNRDAEAVSRFLFEVVSMNGARLACAAERFGPDTAIMSDERDNSCA